MKTDQKVVYDFNQIIAKRNIDDTLNQSTVSAVVTNDCEGTVSAQASVLCMGM